MKKKEKKKIFLSLLTILSEIEDPRNEKGKRHPLVSMLALLIIGLMCGVEGYTSIAIWARSQKTLTQKLGFTREKTPAASTFHNLLKRLDPNVLERKLTKWIKWITESYPEFSTCFDEVAIDGKILRASLKSGAETSHLLSVVSHELGVTLAQRKVTDKTNEIPVSTEILDDIDVKGKVITTDALLTQRTFCSEVIKQGGDYLQPVKKNHSSPYEAIEALFQDMPDTTSENTLHPILKEPIYAHETVEKSHGRLETRSIRASTSLNDYLDWPGLAQVFQVRYTYKTPKTDEEKENTYYGITSLSPEEASAERLLAIKRGHWSIENKSHWMRDTLLGEDASSVRCGSIPHIMASLRNTALSVFRFNGVTRIKDMMRYLASKPKVAYNMIL